MLESIYDKKILLVDDDQGRYYATGHGWFSNLHADSEALHGSYLVLIGQITDAQIIDAMNKVGLDYRDKTKVKGYSLGMKQKLGIAQAFMENQEILLLDEPFNALDFHTYKEIRNVIHDLKNAGKTILLISHNYTDIEELCDRIYVIKSGHLTPATEEITMEYKIANGEIRSRKNYNAASTIRQN